MAINRIPYRISLRVLGRLLNGEKARMVTVCEIDQGFLLHFFRQGQPESVVSRAIHGAEVMDLDDALQRQRGKREAPGGLRGLLGFGQSEALRFQRSHPLIPMGYEEYMRALGDALDRRGAHAVLITELDDGVRAEYTIERADFVLRQGQRLALAGRRQETHNASQIEKLVRESRERAAEQVHRSGQNLTYNRMDITAYLAAAPILEDHGQHREAEDLYRQALEVAPNHAEVHFRLAGHARRRGDHKSALKHLERAVALNGRDGRFFHLLGRVHGERQRFAEAVQPLERALACDPDNKIYQFHLSQVYERLGRIDEARAVLSSREARIDRVASQLLDADPVSVPADRPATPVQAAAAMTHDAAYDAHEQAAAPAPVSHAYGEDEPALEPASAPRRSLAARLDVTEDAAPAPSLDEYLAPGPFDVAAPAWESNPAPPAPYALPPHGGDATLPPSTPEPRRAEEGLPVLGLDVANDWSVPALPTLDLPADGLAAGAALPLAGVSWDHAPTDVTSRGHEPEETVVPGLALTAEPVAPADDAVQLAAAILRMEELVRAEPEKAELHRKLGFLLAKQGRSDEAAASFRRAVECGRHKMAS